MKGFKLLTSAVVILAFSSCTTNAGTGAIAGSIVGAGTGGLIAGGQGALIGGAVGAIGGSLIGVYLDDQDRKTVERSSPRTIDRMDRGEPLTINDVIKLSQASINDDTIIQYIHDTNSSYNLSQSQIRRLQDAGVSKKVISYMIETGN
jgi:outer membrane lipoprotein SlyB